MSRPFLLLFTANSGAQSLSRLLMSHPFVTLRETPFDKIRPKGLRLTPEPRRIEFLERSWSAYQRPVRRGICLPLRIAETQSQLEPDSPFMEVLKTYDPAVLVLRDDNMLMQAVERLNNEAEQTGPITIEIPALRSALQQVRQDYDALDAVAEQLGPVMEIARDEVLDTPDSVMASVSKLLALPASEIALPDDGLGQIPQLNDLVANTDTVRAFAEKTIYAGMV